MRSTDRRTISRRRFLKQAGATAAGIFVRRAIASHWPDSSLRKDLKITAPRYQEQSAARAKCVLSVTSGRRTSRRVAEESDYKFKPMAWVATSMRPGRM